MNIEIRTITEEEFGQWSKADGLGFGYHTTDEQVALSRSFTEVDRTFGAFDGSNIVGTTTTRTTAITIPGGSAKLGYVDDVSVIPTHRRRGIMTGMMRSQLDQMRERGEPMAALGASESLIYERFGFGIATWSAGWKIDRRHTSFKVPPQGGGRLDFIDDETARDEWPKLHARVVGDRPGMVHFNAEYWAAALRDFGGLRPGMSEFFHVAYRRGERVSGLVSYRIRDSSVLAVFLLGEDAEAEAELWRYCFGIDLMTDIEGFNRPTDDPLPWRLGRPETTGAVDTRSVVAAADRRRSRARIAFLRYARRVDARRPRLVLRVERGYLCAGSGAGRLRCIEDRDVSRHRADSRGACGGVSWRSLVRHTGERGQSAGEERQDFGDGGQDVQNAPRALGPGVVTCYQLAEMLC